MGSPPFQTRGDASRPLAALWSYLLSWVGADGGVHGPVVHRADLKRLFAIHDTPWTQAAVIDGLVRLFRRSGHDYWLGWALRLADAQCRRLAPDGRFRWAGHEDDRFSSLIHNVLADCALLELYELLRDRGDGERRRRYFEAAERNLEAYVVGRLYSPELGGFRMNPFDYYGGRDRFICNMNSVTVEALVRLDRQRGTSSHCELARFTGERLLSLQSGAGRGRGGLPYSQLEPDTHVSIYTALAIRGLPWLEELTGDGAATRVAGESARLLERMEDEESGLWIHKIEGERPHRFPIFVAGAGMTCDALVDVASLTGSPIDAVDLAQRLLRHQLDSGALPNFIGYDHPDNGRRGGRGRVCWEDVFPSPNWNAQAFRFLCRVLPPPDPEDLPAAAPVLSRSRRHLYWENHRMAAVVAAWPPTRTLMALWVKRLRYGLVVPGIRQIAGAAIRALERFRPGRAILRRLRT